MKDLVLATAVRVIVDGKTDNGKFFQGPLPVIGDSVIYVYIGDDEDGTMKFQFQTRKWWQVWR